MSSSSKALEDLKPNKIEDIFRIDRLRTDPRRKENRTKKSVSNSNKSTNLNSEDLGTTNFS